MKMSSELLYQMEVSWNPCDVIFFTPAAARSRSSGKKLVEMQKVLIGFFLEFSEFMGNPGTGDHRMEFFPSLARSESVPGKSPFSPRRVPVHKSQVKHCTKWKKILTGFS